MTSNYEPAQIADVAAAGEFIFGEKREADTLDWMTLEFGQMFIVFLNSVNDQ